jgi:hypothetical protein
MVEATILYELAIESTPEDMIRWYDYAIDANIVEYEYDAYGELLGFVDWVRIPRVPVSLDDARHLFETSPGGPVGVMCNAYIREGAPRGLLRKLSSRAREKNPDVEIVCWHNKRTDKMVTRKVMRNIRRQLCEETVV